jgi:ATP-dependent DNA helicase RecG
LRERNLVEAHGEKRRRVYHLSASRYRRMNQPESYVRAHGIDSIRHEEMVLQHVKSHGRIVRDQVAELCGLSNDQAGRLLRRLVSKGRFYRQGTPPRWTYYVLAE